MAAAPKVNKRLKPTTTTTKPATTDKTKKARAPRKPPLERAEKLVTTLEKKCNAIVRNVGRWRVEDAEQAEIVSDIKERALQIKALTEGMAASVGDLIDAGVIIEITGGGGGRTAMGPGDVVTLRDNRHEVEIHGPNDFAIVSLHGKLYRIKSRVNGELHHVPRQWIKRQADADADAEGADEGVED